jgi:hypothetical protein
LRSGLLVFRSVLETRDPPFIGTATAITDIWHTLAACQGQPRKVTSEISMGIAYSTGTPKTRASVPMWGWCDPFDETQTSDLLHALIIPPEAKEYFNITEILLGYVK